MYAKRHKCDLLELCKQWGLRTGRLTKDQLIAQLEQGDRMNEQSPVSERSSLADAAQAPESVPAGSGQPVDEGFPRPPLPKPRGRVGRSPANTEGTVTPPASRGSSQRSSPPSRGSSRRHSASVERMRLEYERELRWEELKLKRQELEEKAKQRKHEEKQRKHELELTGLKSSEAPAAVSEGGPKPTKSFDKHLLCRRKEGEDIDTFLTAFENACELHRVGLADRIAVLTPLLDSTAVEVYSRLKGVEAGDYKLFKQDLLREFGLTPEILRLFELNLHVVNLCSQP
nr:uncharacterized protein LOC116815075 [Chelonoidis abingdonii]